MGDMNSAYSLNNVNTYQEYTHFGSRFRWNIENDFSYEKNKEEQLVCPVLNSCTVHVPTIKFGVIPTFLVHSILNDMFRLNSIVKLNDRTFHARTGEIYRIIPIESIFLVLRTKINVQNVEAQLYRSIRLTQLLKMTCIAGVESHNNNKKTLNRFGRNWRAPKDR